MGTCLFEMGDTEKSIPILEKARILDGKDAFTLNTLGAAYFLKGEIDVGLSLLNDCLHINPDYSEAY